MRFDDNERTVIILVVQSKCVALANKRLLTGEMKKFEESRMFEHKCISRSKRGLDEEELESIIFQNPFLKPVL